MAASSLTGSERERYLRQIILPGWGEPAQERLKRSTVFMAGAGGLGSPVAMYLAAAGVGTLRIADHGNVELSNLNRQLLHGDGDLSRPKVSSAVETLGRINPLVEVVPLAGPITESNIASLAGEADLLVDCLDNFATRFLLNAYAVKRGLPLVHAGVSGLWGQITFIHPPRTACLACTVSEAPEGGVFPILGATAGVLGCLEAVEALKYLTGAESLLTGRLLFCDLETMQFQEVALGRDPACPVCGGS